MEKGPFNFTIRDEERKIDYVVYAYRKMTMGEVRLYIRAWLSGRRSARKSGHRYEIITQSDRNE